MHAHGVSKLDDQSEIFEKLDGMLEGLVVSEGKLADGLGIPFDDAEGA